MTCPHATSERAATLKSFASASWQRSWLIWFGIWFSRGILSQGTHLANSLSDPVQSIEASIAEGTGWGSLEGNRRFVRNARGSLYETRHWLRRARRRGLSNDQVGSIKPLIEELLPELNAQLKSIGTFPGTMKQPTADSGPRTRHD